MNVVPTSIEHGPQPGTGPVPAPGRGRRWAGWWVVPSLLALALFFFLKGVVRVSAVHMVQALVLAILVLALGSRALIVGAGVRWLVVAPVLLAPVERVAD